MFNQLAKHFESVVKPPFDFIVVDEAQDVSVAQLTFLAALGAQAGVPRPNSLFFAGDLGQRIFQLPFSWKSLGVNVRGRARTLSINYRTSHQIRARQAMKAAGMDFCVLDDKVRSEESRVSIRTMHLAKGLEFRAVVVMVCDDEVVPLQSWIQSIADGADLQEVYNTERQQNRQKYWFQAAPSSSTNNSNSQAGAVTLKVWVTAPAAFTLSR